MLFKTKKKIFIVVNLLWKRHFDASGLGYLYRYLPSYTRFSTKDDVAIHLAENQLFRGGNMIEGSKQSCE